MLFHLDDNIYIVERNSGDTDKFVYDKGWFIAYQRPQNECDYEEAEKFATIYANIRNLNCSYSKEIISRLNEMGEQVPFYETL